MKIKSLNGYYSQFTLPIDYIPEGTVVNDIFSMFSKPPVYGGMAGFQTLQNTCDYLQSFLNKKFSNESLYIEGNAKSLQIRVLTPSIEKSNELNNFFKYLDEGNILLNLIIQNNGNSVEFHKGLSKAFESFQLNEELSSELSSNAVENQRKLKI